MKRCLMVKIVLMAVLCLVGAVLCAASPKSYVKDVKISVSSSYAPNPRVQNISTSDKNSLKWVLIEFEVNTEKFDGKNGVYLDDVELVVDAALLNGEKKGVEQVVLFTGAIEYYSIELDGKKHKLLALIPGSIFARYANEKTDPAKANWNIKATLNFRGSAIAVKYYSNVNGTSEKDLKVWFNKYKNVRTVSVREVADAVFARRETPWGMIDHDQYEFEKKAK